MGKHLKTSITKKLYFAARCEVHNNIRQQLGKDICSLGHRIKEMTKCAWTEEKEEKKTCIIEVMVLDLIYYELIISIYGLEDKDIYVDRVITEGIRHEL